MNTVPPLCPVCRQEVALTPVRGQVKVHKGSAGDRCFGSGKPPVQASLSWWRSLQFRRFGKWAYGFVFTAAAGLFTILTYFGIHPHMAYPSGTSGRKASVAISTSGMSVGSSNVAYRLILPIENPRSEDAAVRTLSVLASFWGPPCAEVPSGLVYEVKASVNVDSESRARGTVSASGGLASGLTVPLTGLLSYGCGWNQLQFSFVPPNATLTHLSTTFIAIDLPLKFTVTKSNDQAFATDSVTLPTSDNPGNPVIDFIAFRVFAKTSRSGSISSCYLMAYSASKYESGLQDCGTKIDGVDAFSAENLDVNKPRVGKG
jgi:hypothetical protein